MAETWRHYVTVSNPLEVSEVLRVKTSLGAKVNWSRHASAAIIVVVSLVATGLENLPVAAAFDVSTATAVRAVRPKSSVSSESVDSVTGVDFTAIAGGTRFSSMTAAGDRPVVAGGAELDPEEAASRQLPTACDGGAACRTGEPLSDPPPLLQSRFHPAFLALSNSNKELWSVSLTADRSVFAAGEKVTLTATPNQDIIEASPYSVQIFDATTGRTIHTCSKAYRNSWADGSCAVETSFATGDPHTYRAYVARGPSLTGYEATRTGTQTATRFNMSTHSA